jgi:hypothetical protein
MKQSTAIERLSKLKNMVPKEDVTAALVLVTQAVNETARSLVEVKRIEAERDVALMQIREKHDVYRRVFDQLFSERRDAISKHFEIIDKGIASNNQELILGALQGLGQIVAASPFTNLKLLAQVLEGNSKLEI